MQDNNLIGGESAPSTLYSIERSPADQDNLVGIFARSEPVDVERAIAAARAAFPAWSRSDPTLLGELLGRVASARLDRQDELALLLARREGRTFAEGRGQPSHRRRGAACVVRRNTCLEHGCARAKALCPGFYTEMKTAYVRH